MYQLFIWTRFARANFPQMKFHEGQGQIFAQGSSNLKDKWQIQGDIGYEQGGNSWSLGSAADSSGTQHLRGKLSGEFGERGKYSVHGVVDSKGYQEAGGSLTYQSGNRVEYTAGGSGDSRGQWNAEGSVGYKCKHGGKVSFGFGTDSSGKHRVGLGYRLPF